MSENQFKSMGDFCKAVMATEHREVDPRLTRFDEIMPAELEGIKEGDSIKVSIQHLQFDWLRPLEAIDNFIDRPLFGYPPNSFRLRDACLTEPDSVSGAREMFGVMLYKPRSDEDKLTIKNSAGEAVSEQWLYGCDPCEDMLFFPIVDG